MHRPALRLLVIGTAIGIAVLARMRSTKHVYKKHGEVKVRLHVFDRRGKRDTASVTIRVKRG
jgi:hypothetical protein